MTSAQVVDSKGNKVREVGLDDAVFGIESKEGLLHQALVRQLANARQGSANTKTRAEVAGGGKKPWRQKGTGRARAGSIRSPLWEGGGVIFGPKPRDYSIGMPKSNANWRSKQLFRHAKIIWLSSAVSKTSKKAKRKSSLLCSKV